MLRLRNFSEAGYNLKVDPLPEQALPNDVLL
jgi:hypothetical protein